jgi:hypothetical protein
MQEVSIFDSQNKTITVDSVLNATPSAPATHFHGTYPSLPIWCWAASTDSEIIVAT